MLVLLSPAKTMRSAQDFSCADKMLTEPRLMAQTRELIAEMRSRDLLQLEQELKISPTLAQETQRRFAQAGEESIPRIAALDAYDGVVFKHMRGGKELSEKERAYLHECTRICSLLYGLLRPLDAVHPYRMEGSVKLGEGKTRVDRYWREHQTQLLLDDAREAGGTLIYLASKEEQQAFDWKRVNQELRVLHIEFLQRKGGKLRNVVVYTKMARGEMLRHMIEQNVNDHENLKSFEWEDYRFSDIESSENRWVWVRE